MPLRCWDKDHSEPLHVAIDLEPARIYRISRREGAACEVEVEPTAMVQGRVDGPEIRIRLGDDGADRSWRAPEDLPGLERHQPVQHPPTSRVELAPGSHSLTAVCRRVTRTEVLEGHVAIDVRLETGRIYQLDADFASPDYRCVPRIAIVDDTDVLPPQP